jgi:hypothetical protein
MKIRQGFVTNSSSTSYTIVIKGGLDNADVIYRNHGFTSKEFRALIKVLESSEGDTDVYKVIADSDETLKKYLEDRLRWYDESEVIDVVEYHNKGYAIYHKNISYHDPDLSDKLKKLCVGEEIKIIDADG